MTTSYTQNIKLYTTSLILTTHNIQGMNDNIKFQQWIEFCKDNQLDIVSITETKLAQSTFLAYSLENLYYKVYTSNATIAQTHKRESSMGTAIAITKSLQPFIHNIQTCPGTAIAIDLFNQTIIALG
jgi:exonuclease III